MMMMNNKKYWVVCPTTESGDSLAPLIFLSQPSWDNVVKILKENYPIEYLEVGHIDFVTFNVGLEEGEDNV